MDANQNKVLPIALFDEVVHFRFLSAFNDYTTNKKSLLFCKGIKTESGELLINNILTAIKLSIEDYEVIWINDSNLNLSKFYSSSISSMGLFFGFLPKEVGISFEVPNYQVVSIRQKYLIFSDNVDTLIENKRAKTELWKSLQLLYTQI